MNVLKDRKPYADIEYEYTDANKDKAFEDFDLIIGDLILGIQYEMHDKGVDYLEDRYCIKLSSTIIILISAIMLNRFGLQFVIEFLTTYGTLPRFNMDHKFLNIKLTLTTI